MEEARIRRLENNIAEITRHLDAALLHSSIQMSAHNDSASDWLGHMEKTVEKLSSKIREVCEHLGLSSNRAPATGGRQSVSAPPTF